MFGSGDLGMGIRFVLQDMASGVAAKIGASLKTLSSTATTAAASVQAAAQRLQTGIFGVALAVGLLTAPFISVVNAANKFEYTMSEVFAKGGAENKKELQLLREQALEFGQNSAYNAQQIADAQVEFAKSGFQTIQILRSLKPAMDLAASGDISLAKATEVAGNIMHQFNLTTMDFGHIADVTVLAANKTAQSVEDMAQAMKFAGPNAKSLNMGLEETAATLELMAQGGLRGTIAARSFYNAIIRLADPTNKQLSVLRQFGIDPFGGKNRSFIGVTSLIAQLQAGLSGATGEQTATALSRIIGSDALKNLNSLMNTQIEIVRNGQVVYLKGAEALRYYWEMNKKASEGAGVAAETASTRMDNLQGDIMKFKNTFYTFRIVAGEAFQEGLRPFVQGLTDLLKKITEFAKTPFGQSLIRWTGYLAALTAGMVAFGFVFTVVVPAMWGMITAATKLFVVISPWIALFAGIGYSLYKVTVGMREFSEATLDASGNLEKPMTIFQRIGGFFAGMSEIWNSWNGETFSLSEDLHDKLKANGDLDTVLNSGTYLVRFKEFMKGFASMSADIKPLTDALDDLGDSILNLLGLFGIGEKAKGSTSSWHVLGKQLGDVFSNTLVQSITVITEGMNKFVQSLTYIIAVLQEFGNIDNDAKGGFQWRRVANRVAGRDAEDDGRTSSRVTLTADEERAKKFALSPVSPGAAVLQSGLNSNESLMDYLKKQNGGITVIDKSTIKIEGDMEKFFNFIKQKNIEQFERDQGSN